MTSMSYDMSYKCVYFKLRGKRFLTLFAPNLIIFLTLLSDEFDEVLGYIRSYAQWMAWQIANRENYATVYIFRKVSPAYM